MKKDAANPFANIEEEMAEEAREEWLQKAALQVKLVDTALDAIDRFIGIETGDVILCESTCLDYARHAISSDCGIKELWLVPPHLADYAGSSADLLGDFETRLRASFPEMLDALEKRGGAFRGLTTSVPDEPFKLLVTDKYERIPFGSWLEWPLYNSVWSEMLDTEGSTGAVIYPLTHETDPLSEGNTPLFPTHRAEGAYYSGGFTSVAELPGGHVMLALGKRKGILHVEDLSDPSDPWVRDVAPITIAVNNGNLLPSSLRSCPEVDQEVVLDDLASRISRGTTLSEKALDIDERASSQEGPGRRFPEYFYLVSYGDEGGSTILNSGVGGTAPSYGGYYRYPGDCYYIDGSCFQDGAIRPKVLKSIPRGQERYVVDDRDAEVILVSRSSKEVAVYKHIDHPTLIGNGVFVIRLNRGISIDYLACWLRGSFAKEWIDGEGKLLTKKLLASLPVPILDDEAMERTVRYERSIDESIFNLYQKIAGLKASNRFNPLAASGIEGPAQEANVTYTDFDSDIPF